MKLTISGQGGSGKSTVSKLLAQKLNLKRFSVGDFMGEIALRRNISLLQLSKIAEKDSSVDKELDDAQVEFGKNNDNFVLDSRLGWYFVPDAFKIFLTVDLDVAAQRIFNDPREDEKENTTLQATKEGILRRRKSEFMRYKNYYGVDLEERNNYDLIIDTSKLNPQLILDNILAVLRKHNYIS